VANTKKKSWLTSSRKIGANAMAQNDRYTIFDFTVEWLGFVCGIVGCGGHVKSMMAEDKPQDTDASVTAKAQNDIGQCVNSLKVLVHL
jgi:hypothetical protein